MRFPHKIKWDCQLSRGYGVFDLTTYYCSFESLTRMVFLIYILVPFCQSLPVGHPIMVCFEHNVMTYAFGDEVLWPTFGDHQCFHRAGKEGLLCSVLVYSITTNVVFKFVQSEGQL